jgi:transcriptional regulator with PAS, ATPase and Fis domain
MEKELIKEVLNSEDKNLENASKILGMSKDILLEKIQTYNL